MASAQRPDAGSIAPHRGLLIPCQPGNTLISTTCGFSTDHALSFTNQQVTTVGFDASNNPFIGDYNWQASTNDAVYPIFVGDGVPGGDSNAEEVFVANVTP